MPAERRRVEIEDVMAEVRGGRLVLLSAILAIVPAVMLFRLPIAWWLAVVLSALVFAAIYATLTWIAVWRAVPADGARVMAAVRPAEDVPLEVRLKTARFGALIGLTGSAAFDSKLLLELLDRNWHWSRVLLGIYWPVVTGIMVLGWFRMRS